MSKPYWKDAPEGFDWLAQDADGDWYWWKGRPSAVEVLGYWMPVDGCDDRLAFAAPPYSKAEDWKETLESRP